MAILGVVACLAGACARSDPQTGSAATATSALDGAQATSSTEKPAGKPTPGGQLTIGIDAETDDFRPAVGQWGPSSYVVANALLDPLVALDDKGIAHPYLAESISANGDFTEWTFQLRKGVTFHDGTPVDADAVKQNLDAVKASALTGPAFVAVDAVSVVADHTLVVKMDRPWATFPATLAAQPGYVVAPATLTDPAGADGKIVGSGPFTFLDRQRDTSLKAARNGTYWQKDPDGASLPYLDELDFRVLTDGSARGASLAAGDINAMTVASTAGLLQSTADAADRGEVQRLTNAKTETDEIVLALNTTKAPFDDPIARQALAYGSDQNEMAETAYHGALPGRGACSPRRRRTTSPPKRPATPTTTRRRRRAWRPSTSRSTATRSSSPCWWRPIPRSWRSCRPTRPTWRRTA